MGMTLAMGGRGQRNIPAAGPFDESGHGRKELMTGPERTLGHALAWCGSHGRLCGGGQWRCQMPPESQKRKKTWHLGVLHGETEEQALRSVISAGNCSQESTLKDQQDLPVGQGKIF